MILHYISVTFSHFKKGSKLLQGHAKKGSKFLQVCVKGVVFYKVSFYLKRKKKYLPQKWAVSGSLEKNTQLERATEYAAAKKKEIIVLLHGLDIEADPSAHSFVP